MSTMNLYACGGAGINLVKQFEKFRGKKDEGFAIIEPFYLDTSRSNLSSEAPESSVYLVEGVDGSGKKRDQNYKAITERSKEMLHRFKPADINVVVHSASGGSGSVIGPILVSELLSREAPVVVIMVGSADSKIETNNTVKTLKSYEVISTKRELPVIAVYQENSKDSPRGAVDQQLRNTIILLAAIFSKQNRELDSSDLANFLNYTRVTSFDPHLTFLDFFTNEIEVGKDNTVISAVTLTDEENSSSLNIPVEYQAVGFVHEGLKGRIDPEFPIHAATINGVFHGIIDRLSQRLTEFEEARAVVVDRTFIGKSDSATDEGLIL